MESLISQKKSDDSPNSIKEHRGLQCIVVLIPVHFSLSISTLMFKRERLDTPLNYSVVTLRS